MTNTIKIDKGIPLFKKTPPWPFSQMEVGDSFIIPNERHRTLTSVASLYRRVHQKKFSVRKTDNGDYRCWRLI